MIALKIKKILSLLLAMMLTLSVAIPAFAEDGGSTAEPGTAAASDYDYTKDERLSQASNPIEYNAGTFKWGGLAPAMYGIIAGKMYTIDQVNKAVAIADAKKAAIKEKEAEEAAAAKEKEGNSPQDAEEGNDETFTITFDDNGGSGGPGTQTGKSGKNSLSSTYPTKKGYTFVGWAEDKEALAPKYVVGGVWRIDLVEDVTLYAVWDDGTPALVDETSADPAVEGVNIEAFYAFKCPACGKAQGGNTVLQIYNANKGKCSHAEEYLPDPGTVKIYRFIIVPDDSAHNSALKNHDFTKAAKDIYGSTASQYGDGKDLPQWDLVYEQNENQEVVLTDFHTSGTNAEFKDRFLAKLYIFLVKFQNWAAPRTERFAESGFNNFAWKVNVAIGKGIEKILSFFASGF